MDAAGLGNRLRRGVRRAAVATLDALLPPHCLTCDAAVDHQGSLCGACFAGLSFVTAPFCACCGVPFPHAGAGVSVEPLARNPQAGPAAQVCPACAAHPPAFAMARAALRYDAASQRLVLPFKNADRTELAGPLARHMARAGAELLARADLLTPVPLHWRRLLSRRYNQAALLSARLSRLAGKPHVPGLLWRIRATPPLREHSAAARSVLLENAFALGRGGARRVAGQRVLLVDDVLTSGATAEACAMVLLEAGALAVEVLAAARVPDPRLDEQG